MGIRPAFGNGTLPYDSNGYVVQKASTAKPKVRWDILRPALMLAAIAITVFISSFFAGWIGDADSGEPDLESTLRYGSIPVIAAIIGYGTNVVALQMMFYPLEFIGYF